MKNYIKGIITGIIIGAAVCSIPALADTIDALFNEVRISVNGVDQIQWGENIKLSDGAETPASILYNGTTYLPMRKLGELSGNKVYWNGDSRTVGMTDAQKDIRVLAEKPDKNGNVWKYYTFKDNNDYCYLGVKDEARGYERVYLMACDTFNVTDNEIYFLRQDEIWKTNTSEYPPADLVKLSFENDENTQDGEIIATHYLLVSYGGDVLIYKDYIFHSGHGPGTSARGIMTATNYLTGERAVYDGDRWTNINNLHIIESDNEHIVIGYDLNDGGGAWGREITFDKTTNKFSEPTVTGKRVAPQE